MRPSMMAMAADGPWAPAAPCCATAITWPAALQSQLMLYSDTIFALGTNGTWYRFAGTHWVDVGSDPSAYTGLYRRDPGAAGAVHQRQLRRDLDHRRRSVGPPQRASHGGWLCHAAPAASQRTLRAGHERHVVVVRRHVLGERRRRSAGPPGDSHRPAGAVSGRVRRQHRRQHPFQLLRHGVPSTNFETVRDRLVESGIRHIRDAIPGLDPGY